MLAAKAVRSTSHLEAPRKTESKERVEWECEGEAAASALDHLVADADRAAYIQVSPYFDPTYTRTGWIGQPPVLDRHEVVTDNGDVDTLRQATP